MFDSLINSKSKSQSTAFLQNSVVRPKDAPIPATKYENAAGKVADMNAWNRNARLIGMSAAQNDNFGNPIPGQP